MSSNATHSIRQETDLLARFAQTYQPRFAELIDRLNRSHAPEVDAQGLRLCVEAMSMILAAHSELARAMSVRSGS
jgi:hypothetical protein